jgi:NarL family two-component system response regulator YdfI
VIRVLIVAASSFARAGLQGLVRGREVVVVGSAPSFESLAEQWAEAEADVVLVEASGGQADGIMESLAASELAAEAAIVVLSDHSEPRWIADALRAGVRAVLPSDVPRDQLIAALQAVVAGLVVMHPSEAGALFPEAQRASRAAGEVLEALTPRESEVLQMLASGLGNKEIASRLAISEHTVKFHVASILGKLGAGTRTEAVSLGIRRGLVIL